MTVKEMQSYCDKMNASLRGPVLYGPPRTHRQCGNCGVWVETLNNSIPRCCRFAIGRGFDYRTPFQEISCPWPLCPDCIGHAGHPCAVPERELKLAEAGYVLWELRPQEDHPQNFFLKGDSLARGWHRNRRDLLDHIVGCVPCHALREDWVWAVDLSDRL